MTKIAYVKWIDAESRRPQMSLKSLRNAEGLGVETAGLIVQNSRKTLVVVQDIFDDAEDYDDRDARMAEIIHIEAAKMLNPERILMTGNALSVAGEFYEAHTGRDSLYQRIQITAEDTPNIIEGRVVIPGMMTQEDIEERKKEWGEDSPEYRASVLAEFTIGGGRNYFDMKSVLAMESAVKAHRPRIGFRRAGQDD